MRWTACSLKVYFSFIAIFKGISHILDSIKIINNKAPWISIEDSFHSDTVGNAKINSSFTSAWEGTHFIITKCSIIRYNKLESCIF